MMNVRRAVIGGVLAALAVGVMAGPAGANHQVGSATISCDHVMASFDQFLPVDHPIKWNVKVGAGAYAPVATGDFVGPSGIASANIESLTAGLGGVPTVVSAYASWTAHTGPVTSVTVTCGTVPTTTTVPPTTTTKPPASDPVVVADVPAGAVAVVARPGFTG